MKKLFLFGAFYLFLTPALMAQEVKPVDDATVKKAHPSLRSSVSLSQQQTYSCRNPIDGEEHVYPVRENS